MTWTDPLFKSAVNLFDYDDRLPDRNPRTAAQWRAALKELEDAALLEDEGNQGQRFMITHRGYEVADMIEATT